MVWGLKILARPPFDFPGHWQQVANTGQLHLMVCDETIPQRRCHFALEVADFEEAVRDLKIEKTR